MLGKSSLKSNFHEHVVTQINACKPSCHILFTCVKMQGFWGPYIPIFKHSRPIQGLFLQTKVKCNSMHWILIRNIPIQKWKCVHQIAEKRCRNEHIMGWCDVGFYPRRRRGRCSEQRERIWLPFIWISLVCVTFIWKPISSLLHHFPIDISSSFLAFHFSPLFLNPFQRTSKEIKNNENLAWLEVLRVLQRPKGNQLKGQRDFVKERQSAID